jgi:acyl carrier protein
MLDDHHPLVAYMVERISDLAGKPPDAIDLNATLEALGVDSADAVILAAEAEDYLGREVDADLFLRCPTIGEALGELVQLTEAKGVAAETG